MGALSELIVLSVSACGRGGEPSSDAGADGDAGGDGDGDGDGSADLAEAP